MSSIYVINKAVNSAKGGGLPFYKSIDKVFSAVNKGFNDTLGLLRVPKNIVPTFQLWLLEPTFVSLRYLETTGGGALTGTVFVPSSIGIVGTGSPPIAVSDDGVSKYIYQTTNPGFLVTPAPIGRWVIELRVNNGVSDVNYYSEEFITCTN